MAAKYIPCLTFCNVGQEGSRLTLIKTGYIVPVPKHREIRRGLLTEIIAEAELTRKEFLKPSKEV